MPTGGNVGNILARLRQVLTPSGRDYGLPPARYQAPPPRLSSAARVGRYARNCAGAISEFF